MQSIDGTVGGILGGQGRRSLAGAASASLFRLVHSLPPRSITPFQVPHAYPRAFTACTRSIFTQIDVGPKEAPRAKWLPRWHPRLVPPSGSVIRLQRYWFHAALSAILANCLRELDRACRSTRFVLDDPCRQPAGKRRWRFLAYIGSCTKCDPLIPPCVSVDYTNK